MKKYLVIILSVSYCLMSCKKGDNISLDLGESIGVDQLDSFTISSSSVQFDSIPTSGTSRILVGNLNDSFSGSTGSNSIFQIDLTSTTDLAETAAFDSINLVLYYDRYAYGDTLLPQTLHIHQLNKNVELKDIPTYLDDDEKPVFVSSTALYNTSNTSYQAIPLASITYTPHPNAKDSITLKLPAEMGNEWFNMIKNKDVTMTNSTAFLEYFKGFALVSDPSNQNMVGFKSDSIHLNINYSYINTEGYKKEAKIVFPINSSLQYNHISWNRSLTDLSALTNNKVAVNALYANHQTLVQSGTGVVTQIKIPGLPNFYEANDLSINHAELRIPVLANSNSSIKLPESLVMMYANKNNTPQSLLKEFASSDETQYGYLQKESGAIDKYYYSFNVTNDLKTMSNNEKLNKPMLLSYALDNLFNSVEQATIINQSSNKIKLIITYTKF